MDRTKEFFLKVLEDHINGNKTEAQEGLDWNELLTLAASHEVGGIVSYQCKGFIPKELQQRFDGAFANSLVSYANRVRLFKEISETFTTNEIPFYCVKGLEVANLYPVPALRTMGDCDLLLHPEDRPTAFDVLTALNYVCDDKPNIEWLFFKNGFEFEIHSHLSYESNEDSKEVFEFCEKAWDYVLKEEDSYKHNLDWSYHFIYLLIHLRKHISHQGVGFRQFLDLSVVIKNKELDYNFIKKTMQDLQMEEFLNVCLNLIHRWFKTEVIVDNEIDEEFYEQVTESIFKNGVFGFDNEENEKNFGINMVNESKKVTIFTRLRILLEYIFWPYEKMKSDQYPFLYKYPWLLPYAWLLRILRAIRLNRAGSRLKTAINASSLSQSELDDRNDYLSKWGIK